MKAYSTKQPRPVPVEYADTFVKQRVSADVRQARGTAVFHGERTCTAPSDAG
jgi:hypothetical protein